MRLGLRLCRIADLHFEVFPIGIYGYDDDLVAEHKFEIDVVRGDLDHFVSTCNACEQQDSVLAKRL